jgi:hypothetical protein
MLRRILLASAGAMALAGTALGRLSLPGAAARLFAPAAGVHLDRLLRRSERRLHLRR